MSNFKKSMASAGVASALSEPVKLEPTRWGSAVELAAAVDGLIRSVAQGAMVLTHKRIDGEAVCETKALAELTTDLQKYKAELEDILRRVPTEDRDVEEDEHVIYLEVFERLDNLRVKMADGLVPRLAQITLNSGAAGDDKDEA